MNNYIYEYYQAISDGSIVVGEWIRLVYEYLIKGLENKSFFYDAKKANKAIKFIENFCHHHEGVLAPQLIKLELWQKALVSAIFGIVDSNGNRQFREVVVEVSRKNGKTLLAAAIAEYCLYMDGEYGARLYFAAPKLQQANLCYDAMYQMIKKEPELDELTKKRRTDVYVETTNSSAQPLAFSAKRSDGLNCSFVCADECSSWEGEAGIKFYEVIKSSFGARRQPLLLSISTAGYVNEGIFDELIKRSTAVLMGSSKETRLLPILYTIDDVDKWNDINELRKSNPNLGVSVTVDYLLEEIAVAEQSISKKMEFLTKYCNIKQNATKAWISTKTIKKTICEEITMETLAHSYAVAGIDLSQTTDLTSACVIVEKNGIEYVLSHFWLPEAKIDEAIARDRLPYREFIEKGWLTLSGDNFIDYHDVSEWFFRLVRDYEILPLVTGYDRYSANYLIQEMQQNGFLMDDVYQGSQLYPILMEAEAKMKDGTFKIGTNDLLKIHILNSAIKMDVEKGRGRLVKINPKDHIDGMAAVIDALTVKSKWHETYGQQWKN